MTETKFTKDGRKVAIIGKLNTTEYIVQEIFVRDDGSEIPAGEQFTATGLLDEPMPTYKDKEIAKKEKRLEELKQQVSRKWRQHQQQERELRRRAETHIKSLRGYEKLENLDAFNMVLDFIAGRITHGFVGQYKPAIVTLGNLEGVDSQPRDFGDELKLISLFGRSGGDLEYRISQYSDGSGGSTMFYPCRSYEEALEIAQARYEKRCEAFLQPDTRPGISSANTFPYWDEWMKIEGLKVNEAAKEKHMVQTMKALQSNVEKQRQELDDRVAKLNAHLEEMGGVRA